MTLVEFLRERLDEDEQAARDVRPDQDYSDSAHQDRWSPARVLREVEAKRRIIGEYERYVAERRRAMGGWDTYSEQSPIITALAAVYADHPEYDESWRP
jgi:uncharacterized protein DUF6221